MTRTEHYPLSPAGTFLLQCLDKVPTYYRRRRIAAWEGIYRDARSHADGDAHIALADAVSQSIERRAKRTKSHMPFKQFLMLVGEQGSGKDTLGRELVRRGFTLVTMSDIVRAVAPALGFSPDTTQGKIDAGHKMRWLFGRSVLLDLSIERARQDGADKIVVVGPRSTYEVRAAHASHARVIGLIAHPDRAEDTRIRLRRVTVDRLAFEPGRIMTPKDFYSREKQERRRTRRMLSHADRVIVTDRPAADIADTLVTGGR